LSEAVDRVVAGEPLEKAFSEFLDTFYASAADTPEARFAILKDEPVMSGDAKLDALAAAVAEYLAKQNFLRVPAWIADQRQVLKEPWFTTPSDDPGMREWLVFSSPAEFRNHNIFTEDRPLRRKGGGSYRPPP